jgi:shikimate kinase
MTQTLPPSADAAPVLAGLGDRCVVLVGLMGAGKSSVGRRLAARLGIPFVDADTEIEAAAALSIPEIFEKHGESYFRAGEVRVMARLLEAGPQVVATGGGAYMNEETRAAVKRRGVSVWLKADLDVLMRRVRRRQDRPLLRQDDPEAVMRRLIDERYPVYAGADLTVLSRDVTHEMVVDDVLAALASHFAGSGDFA